MAYLCNYRQSVFSNEKSADESNVNYLNTQVNHQHDKSYTFEKLFRDYNQKYISNINYFSSLRPIGELQIAKLFSQLGQKYFKSFISCNVGQKENYWCLKCPKCLSTFMLLYPFLGEETAKIFGVNLYGEMKHKSILEALILPDIPKPFECVATKEEMVAAVVMAYEKSSDSNLKLLDYAYGLVQSRGLDKNIILEKVMSDFSKRHFLPRDFEKILSSAIEV